jgi:LysR family transcriptional regulator, transcriptional activator for dmlA
MASALSNVTVLRLLVQVARTGSFSAAGRVLGLSAPSVFRYMNLLEDEIGATLFRRSSRRIMLTEAGTAVLAQAGAIVREFDELKINISASESRSGGVLRIHTRIATGNELVVPVLAEFRLKHRDIQLQLIISDGPIDFRHDNIDASITTDAVHEPAIVSEEIVSCTYVLCASPGYLRRAGVPAEPAELGRHDCITFQHDAAPAAWRVRRAGRAEVVAPRSVVHTNNAGAMIPLALDDAGIVLLPHWLLANELRAGRLQAILTRYEFASAADGEFQRTVLAHYSKSRAGYPQLRTFVEFLAAALRRRARSGWR